MIERILYPIGFRLFGVPRASEDWLTFHRHLRDCGTYILLIGVIAEYLIDEYWEIEHPPLLRGRKATTLLKTKSAILKRLAMLVAAIVFVGGGIGLESLEGSIADELADQIRFDLSQRLADAASGELKLERLSGDREIVRDAAFDRLSRFKSVVFWLQTIDFPNPNQYAEVEVYEAVRKAASEANSFSVSFRLLGEEGWDSEMIEKPVPDGPDLNGVHIYSWRAEPKKLLVDSFK